jgi:hypothetical protein
MGRLQTPFQSKEDCMDDAEAKVIELILGFFAYRPENHHSRIHD